MSKFPSLDFVQKDIYAVEELMRSQAKDFHPDLGTALDILLASGGKRIRPAIVLLVGEMVNAPIERLITLSAAIELLHTATLVHDDLIDNSLLRRGMPTLNAQWNTGATVLTGDFLFARAARLASEVDSLPVMKLFAQTLSIIVNGEITQLFSRRCKVSRADYYQRTYAKTASLFETSASAPALISQSDGQTLESLQKFGYEIGMAFQIMDDILDFPGEQTILGKPVANDLRQGLVTLPTLYFLEQHPNDPNVQHLFKEDGPDNEEKTTQLIESIRQSDCIGLAFNEAKTFVARGLEQLNKHPAGRARRTLEELAQFIVQRDL